MKRKVRYTLIRVKFCRTAMMSTFLLLVVALASCFDSRWTPCFVCALILYVITVLPAIYLKQYEEEAEKHE